MNLTKVLKFSGILNTKVASQIGNRYAAAYIACVAGGFKELGVYYEGNYGERNEEEA